MKPVTSVLIIAPQWVGDLVMAQVLFKCLKQQWPAAQLDVVVPPWGAVVTQAMPEIHRTYALQSARGKLGLRARWALARTLRAQGYSRAIVLPGSFKSALLPWLAGIPVRIGWRGEWRYGLLNDLRVLNKATHPLMIQRYAALAFAENTPLLDALPSPSLTVDSAAARATAEKLGLAADGRKVLAVCPGAAFGRSKQWPQLYLSAVVQQKIDEGWTVWLLGSPNERKGVQALINLKLLYCHDLFNTSLEEMMQLFTLADAVLSNDSGAMHLAAAVNRPLIAVYGSTTPAHTPPLSDKAVALREPLDCSPCFKRTCQFGHYRCMQSVTPARVLAAVSEVVG